MTENPKRPVPVSSLIGIKELREQQRREKAIQIEAERPHADQVAAERREKAARVTVKRVRRLAAEAVRAPGELDELATETLASKLADLISRDQVAKAALIREMLPSYLAQHAAAAAAKTRRSPRPKK